MKISAEKILAGIKVAPPYNIIKLTDHDSYDMVPYSEFRGAVNGLDEEDQVLDLLDRVTQMTEDLPAKSQKIYEYFILSLCLIFQGNKK